MAEVAANVALDAPDGTTVLVLASAIFVFLMTIPGLALFYGSLVSRKNLIDTMLQSVVLTGTIPLVYWLIGYSLCFSTPSNGFIGGTERAFLNWGPASVYAGVPEGAWCIFQLTFGLITAAIAVGAVAERTFLWPIVVLANIWFLIVYCPICHMVWGGGILQQWGVLDTAGGLVVETASGVTALTLCYWVGSRKQKGDEPDKEAAVLHIVGASLLFVGWLGFNGGSAYTSGGRASTTMMNTFLAGSAGAIGWLSMACFSNRRLGMRHLAATFHLMGGAVAGLCAATPSSGFVTPSSSVAIGAGAGVVCYFANEVLMLRVLLHAGVDDVVSVFPVHGVGGMFGTLMTGFLATKEVGGASGAIDGNWNQVVVQLQGIGIVSAWCIVGTSILAMSFNYFGLLRAEEEHERHGMDNLVHAKTRKFMRNELGPAHLHGCDAISSEEDTVSEGEYAI